MTRLLLAVLYILVSFFYLAQQHYFKILFKCVASLAPLEWY